MKGTKHSQRAATPGERATTPPKLNTLQLSTPPNAGPNGLLGCDRCCGKALVARGFAVERYQPGCRHGHAIAFFITPAGRKRAQRGADVQSKRDGPMAAQLGADLMLDLPLPDLADNAPASVTDATDN